MEISDALDLIREEKSEAKETSIPKRVYDKKADNIRLFSLLK